MSVSLQRRAALLDLFEQYSLALIFLWFASRMLATVMANGSPFAAIYLFDQLLVVAIIMFRRRTGAITQSGWEWFAGYAGTFLPLLVMPAWIVASSRLLTASPADQGVPGHRAFIARSTVVAESRVRVFRGSSN